MPSTGERFERAVAIMARLRAPGGCPWDREQTFDSIKPYTLEETYEVLEAIDQRDWQELPGELGDLLLQVLFYAEMAKEEERFSIDDVLERLSNKLVSRHPHVFGDVKADTPGEVLRNWEALKRREKEAKEEKAHETQAAAKPQSVLAGISTAMPALMEAYKISTRAATAGFEWPHIADLFDKLTEESEELKAEVKRYPEPGPAPHGRGVAGSGSAQRVPEELRVRLEDEVGDLLFTCVNLARYLSLDPESALRRTNRKFKRRFQQMEAGLHERGKSVPEATLKEMEELWQAAKVDDQPNP